VRPPPNAQSVVKKATVEIDELLALVQVSPTSPRQERFQDVWHLYGFLLRAEVGANAPHLAEQEVHIAKQRPTDQP